MEYLSQHIESLIFTAQSPISFDDIKSCLEEAFETKFKKKELEDTIEELMNRYKAEEFAFEIVQINNGYQFLTKGAYHQSVGTFLRQSSKKRLSKAAVETLSIIAYKQPVAKSEMEKIRGVSCDYSVQKLLEKELIAITGRSDGPGRPLLYGTSEKFMDYFGINSLADLPKPKDFREPENSVGESAPIEEDLPSGNQDSATDEVPNDDEAISHTNVIEQDDAENIPPAPPVESDPVVEANEPSNEVVNEKISADEEEAIIDPDLAEDEDDVVEAVDEMEKLKQLSELSDTSLTEVAPIDDVEEMPVDNLNVVHIPDEVVMDEINVTDDVKEEPEEALIEMDDTKNIVAEIKEIEDVKEEVNETPIEIDDIQENILEATVNSEKTNKIKDSSNEIENLIEDTEIVNLEDEIKPPSENLIPPIDVISEEE